jgi:hypothetical protein
MNLRLGIASALAAGLLGLSALSGCGMFERVADGGTIETTNGIAAKVVLPSGQPASDIKIYLLDEQDWLEKTKAGESIILDVVETDSAGNFKFKIAKADSDRTVGLYADVETYGLLIHDATQQLLKDAFGNVIGMTKKVSYEGTIKDTTFDTQKIYLAGTPFNAVVDSVGHFIIKNVPPESYAVVIERRLPDQSREFVVGEKVKLDEYTEGKPTIITPDTTKAILLEDFEDGDNANLLHPILGYQSWWDAASDLVSGGNATLLQPTNASIGSFQKAIRDGAGDRGKSLQVLYNSGTHPGQGEPFSYVMLTTNLGGYAIHYDLSHMDSLTFFSGGSGKLVVELVQENPKNPLTLETVASLQVVASKTFVLDSLGWTKFTIKPDDLTISVGWFPENLGALKTNLESGRVPAYTEKPTTWAEMGGKITRIRFKGTGGKEFWLDHIRIHGISAGELVR